MTTDAEIGARIQELRGGMPQRVLADQIRAAGFKWSQATVWAVESGERPLRLTEAAEISRALGVPVDALLGSDAALELARKQARLERALQSFEAAKAEVEQARLGAGA